MPKLNNRGSAQIIITIILILGILTLLSQIRKTQIFQPKAATNSTNTARQILLDTTQALIVNKTGDRIIFKSEKQSINQNPGYYVEYQPSFDLFMLVINDAPIEEVREQAEKDLLQKAGGDLQSLCNLKFSIVASKEVTDDQSIATDDTLGICKELQERLGNRLLDNFTPSLGNTLQSIKSAILEEGGKTFLSDKPLIASQDLPDGVYISLCRNDGTDAEGVWQINKNPKAADFLYNQPVGRCNWPVPNYLVFVSDVPTGTYLSLCETNNESEPARESVWQVNDSGRVADFLHIQDVCSEVPSLPKPKPASLSRLYSFPVSGQKCSIVNQGYCSLDYLTPYFGSNAANASKICFSESGGNPFAFNGSDAGLFQINLASHGGFKKEHWFDVENNINKAVSMSGGGVNWRAWSVAYEYACINGRRVDACGIYPGKVPWHNPC